MGVKEAVQAAERHVADVLAQAQVAGLGLEKAGIDGAHGAWRAAPGFSRPWDAARSPFPAPRGDLRRQHSHKAVSIAGQPGKVPSVKNWTGQ